MTTALAITDRALTTTDVMTAFGALLLIATAQQYGRGLCKAGREAHGHSYLQTNPRKKGSACGRFPLPAD
jgi:hypothetical protein